MKSGGEIISLLYVINNKRYKEHLETDKFKYVFTVFTPTFNSKLLDELIIREEVKGDIAGINLKEIDYKESNTLKKIIKSINKLKEEDHRYIFIEELVDNSLDVKDEIEAKTGLYFLKEHDLKIYNIKIILEKLLESKNTLKEEEVLIICGDQELTYKIIELLYEKFLFISILEDVEWGNTICKNILNDIGLSIFRQKDLSKSINKYGIIINMEKEISIDVNNVKKEAIIFDYSNGYNFRSTKNNLLIEDITIENTDEGSSFLPNELISSIYEKLNNANKESFSSIYSRGKFYTLEELIKEGLINSKKVLKGSI